MSQNNLDNTSSLSNGSQQQPQPTVSDLLDTHPSVPVNNLQQNIQSANSNLNPNIPLPGDLLNTFSQVQQPNLQAPIFQQLPQNSFQSQLPPSPMQTANFGQQQGYANRRGGNNAFNNVSNSRSGNRANNRSDRPSSTPIDQTKYDDDEPLDSKEAMDEAKTELTSKDVNVDSVTHLSTKLKRNNLQASSFNDQTFPMLVSLAVDEFKSANKTPLDLVCVLDHSGSMSGQKMELVKNTFNYLLEYLSESDRLSIVIFDDKVHRLTPLLRMTAANKERTLAELKNISANGGTDIDLGLRSAFEALKKRRQQNTVSSIFLLSDGLDGGAQQKVKQSLIKHEVPADVTINTFGFGNDHDPKLMTDIADLRDGNFYFIEKLDTVDEAFVDCLGGLISSIAQSVTITIRPEQSTALQGVELSKAYGDASMWVREGDSYVTKMAILLSGKQKDYVLDLKIPKTDISLTDEQKSVKVASVEAVISTFDNKTVVKKTELIITLLNEDEEVKENEDDNREVMKNFYRVKSSLLMAEASRLADARSYEPAKKMLESFREEVANSVLKDEEFIKNLIKDLDMAIKDVNPVVYESSGKNNMYNNFRGQMQQKSMLQTANCYQNNFQQEMMFAVKSKK